MDLSTIVVCVAFSVMVRNGLSSAGNLFATLHSFCRKFQNRRDAVGGKLLRKLADEMEIPTHSWANTPVSFGQYENSETKADLPGTQRLVVRVRRPLQILVGAQAHSSSNRSETFDLVSSVNIAWHSKQKRTALSRHACAQCMCFEFTVCECAHSPFTTIGTKCDKLSAKTQCITISSNCTVRLEGSGKSVRNLTWHPLTWDPLCHMYVSFFC